MTYTLTLTPYLAAQLAACCLHAGLDVRNIFPAHLTRHTTAPAVTVEEPTPTPATQPELALGYEPTPTPLPTGMGLTARVAWLEGQRTNNNNNNH